MIRLRAPAKVNLFLEITGQRVDGYHLLSTLFQTVSLADCLTFRPDEQLRMTCSDATLSTDESNLVLKAARALQKALGISRGAWIHLEKNIPLGAGLGGGSSDAAAVLLGLQQLWKKQLSQNQLHRCAVRLGADVPFFLKQGLCAATGIGDRLKSLAPLPRLWIVLVYPGFGVSTKESFARVRLPWKQKQSMGKMLSALKQPTAAALAPHLFNRFEELVFPRHRLLLQLKNQLLRSGAAGVLMSGSGSTLFALVHSKIEGQWLLQSLRPRYPRSWLVHTEN